MGPEEVSRKESIHIVKPHQTQCESGPYHEESPLRADLKVLRPPCLCQVRPLIEFLIGNATETLAGKVFNTDDRRM